MSAVVVGYPSRKVASALNPKITACNGPFILCLIHSLFTKTKRERERERERGREGGGGGGEGVTTEVPHAVRCVCIV